MTTKADDFALFVAVLAEADARFPGPSGPMTPQATLARAHAFRHLARVLERAAVAECDGTLTPRQAAARDRAAQDAREYAKMTGANALIGGDPRGYVIKLDLPTGRYNTWGGAEDGWGVPT